MCNHTVGGRVIGRTKGFEIRRHRTRAGWKWGLATNGKRYRHRRRLEEGEGKVLEQEERTWRSAKGF